MKNPNNKTDNGMEHSSIAISATLAEPQLLKNIVEKLADRRYDIGYGREKVKRGWQAIETSSIEINLWLTQRIPSNWIFGGKTLVATFQSALLLPL